MKREQKDSTEKYDKADVILIKQRKTKTAPKIHDNRKQNEGRQFKSIRTHANTMRRVSSTQHLINIAIRCSDLKKGQNLEINKITEPKKIIKTYQKLTQNCRRLTLIFSNRLYLLWKNKNVFMLRDMELVAFAHYTKNEICQL